jgi:hypothetical protein
MGYIIHIRDDIIKYIIHSMTTLFKLRTLAKIGIDKKL